MDSILNMLINKSKSCTKIINNNNFTINYSRNLGRPLFAAYDIFPNQISKFKYGRKNFKRDYRLDCDQIYQLDPTSKIFADTMSRGHLCPSFMMSHDKSHNGSWASTYLMSNIIPQNREFNCGAWHNLEMETFNFIKKVSKHVKVVVGAADLDHGSSGFSSTKLTKPIIWFDEKNEFKYKVPNAMYYIVITDYEVKCHIGFNNSNQQVYSIDLDNLLSLI
jgi:DNA/RNA endonuclease G (NUC1)